MKRQSRGSFANSCAGEFYARRRVPVGTQSGSPHSDISRILFPAERGVIIHLGPPFPTVSSSRPGAKPTDRGTRAPACDCTWWGLPCPTRHRVGGALLPHPFTLTPGRAGGGLLSVALSLTRDEWAGGGYPPPCPVVSGLSSRGTRPPTITCPSQIVSHKPGLANREVRFLQKWDSWSGHNLKTNRASEMPPKSWTCHCWRSGIREPPEALWPRDLRPHHWMICVRFPKGQAPC